MNPLSTPEMREQIRLLNKNVQQPLGIAERIIKYLYSGEVWQSPAEKNYQEGLRRARTGTFTDRSHD